MIPPAFDLATPFDALLICNGAPPDRAMLQALAARAALVVCADGGANVARASGILPHLIIGDLDSITTENRGWFEALGVEIRRDAGQDDTDFEKALRHLSNVGARTLVIAGMTGALLDHTLGNFSILQRYARRFECVLIDPEYRIDVITRDAEFACVPGERISIVPFPIAKGVSYQGLRYPLTDAEMAYGKVEGTCNEATGSRVAVTMRGGMLLVFRSLPAHM
jgi:thiamine pyrophosphokinase